MKKLLLTATFLIIMIAINAQNVQLHYDYGKDRGYLTSTVEMFKPDKWGATFFFIDMNYSVADNVDGISLGYWEIARTLKLGKATPFSAHFEYNGGMGKYIKGESAEEESMAAFTINDAYLVGIDYSWNASDFSKGFSLKALYKSIKDIDNASFQITGVWYYNAFDSKLTFSGFADFWKEEKDFDGEADGDYVFLTEPQLWYNATKNISIGGEVELSNNFVTDEFKVMPTAAIKWTF